VQFRITASNLTLRPQSDALIQTQFNRVLGSAVGQVIWMGVRFSKTADRIQCDVQATLVGNIAAYASGWGENWLDAAHMAAQEIAKIVPARKVPDAKLVKASGNAGASVGANANANAGKNTSVR
jgi:hypothetical protein